MTIPAIPNPAFRTTSNQSEAFLSALTGRASGLNLFAYGHSYTALNQPWYTLGEHWLDLVADELEMGTATSYGIASSRIISVLSGLVNESNFPNVGLGVVSGAKWPGTSSRVGVGVLDVLFNDVGHYPSMQANPVVPATITSANTRYLDGLEGMYRHVLALMSSETRVEQTSGSYTGTWVNTALGAAYASGGSLAYTTTAGAYVEFSVTPAQSGPLAGVIQVCLFKLDASDGTMAQVTTTIDGGSSANHTPTAWEQYTGSAGGDVNIVTDVITLTLPIDGAAHTIRIAHSGAGGEFLYLDNLLIPSADPNPILMMGTENPPVAHAGVFDAAGITAWKYNEPLVRAVAQDVAAEFPNVIYVPSTMTSNGLYSADGVHPNDRGMHQRAGDAAIALREILPRLRSRALYLEPDGSFGVI